MPFTATKRHITFTAPSGATQLIGDFTDDTDRAIALEPGASVTLEFPLRAYVEYAFLDARGKRMADPSNSFGGDHPWYKEYRAVALPSYQPSTVGDALEGVVYGKTESLSWKDSVLPGTRRAYVHVPANLESGQRYPVFFVQDGVAYRRTGRLGAALDNLIHAGRVSPAVLVFLEPADRTEEYFFNPLYPRFLLEEVLPRVEAQFPVSRDAADRGLWGASLGGLAALWTAMQHPDVFGRVVTQSAAVQGRPGTRYARGAQEWLLEQFQTLERLPLRVSMNCGQLEWLLGANRRFAAMLFDKGYAHQYFEHASGHNWVTWRDGTERHLEWILGDDRSLERAYEAAGKQWLEGGDAALWERTSSDGLAGDEW
jgi:enterochelin esterase family protein